MANDTIIIRLAEGESGWGMSVTIPGWGDET